MAKYLLRVRDVTGVEIRMTRECWRNHIVVRHPVMRRYFDQVGRAIGSADVIHQSPTPRETRFYYRRVPRRQLWVLVIADMKPSGNLGYVKPPWWWIGFARGRSYGKSPDLQLRQAT